MHHSHKHFVHLQLAGLQQNHVQNLLNHSSFCKKRKNCGKITVLNIHCCFLHTHTHPFNGPLTGTTRLSRYQRGKTNLDFTEARDSEWQWHQLGHMQVCTSLQTDNHANTSPLSFLQAGCPSCRPTNSVKALKACVVVVIIVLLITVTQKRCKVLQTAHLSASLRFLHCTGHSETFLAVNYLAKARTINTHNAT